MLAVQANVDLGSTARRSTADRIPIDQMHAYHQASHHLTMQASDPDVRPRQRRATETVARDPHCLPDTDSRSRHLGAIGAQQSQPSQLADELAELCTFRTAGSGRSIHISNPDSLEQERVAGALASTAVYLPPSAEHAVLCRPSICCKVRPLLPRSQHSCQWEQTGPSCRS